jgi:4'-phosphopantetheinyl transferase
LGPAGKPFLADQNPALQFNLSDSGDLALIGFARGCDLGVDIEFVKRMADTEMIASRFFSPEECSDLLGLAEEERTAAFFRCWTRKEAYLKALGDGLAAPLDSFQVTLRPNEEPRLLRTALAGGETAHWHLYHLAPAPDYFGAVAYTGAPRKIHEWPLITPDGLVR